MIIDSVLEKDGSRTLTIPKEPASKDAELIIQKFDNCYFLIPKSDEFALLRQTIGALPVDTPFFRDQPEFPERNF